MKWYWWCFDAVSYDQNHPERGQHEALPPQGQEFSTEVSHEHGNYDYLMRRATWTWRRFVRGRALLLG